MRIGWGEEGEGAEASRSRCALGPYGVPYGGHPLPHRGDPGCSAVMYAAGEITNVTADNLEYTFGIQVLLSRSSLLGPFAACTGGPQNFRGR